MIEGLIFIVIGLLFIVFRRFFARGAHAYTKRNFKKGQITDDVSWFELLYIVAGILVIVAGVYVIIKFA
jgi:heme/copper-type cytochrome/quinol oxidase subunit 2